jgi:hypothetical protein
MSNIDPLLAAPYFDEIEFDINALSDESRLVIAGLALGVEVEITRPTIIIDSRSHDPLSDETKEQLLNTPGRGGKLTPPNDGTVMRLRTTPSHGERPTKFSGTSASFRTILRHSLDQF